MEQYFYLDSEQKQYGPCSLEELRAAGITRNTKVWRAGMTDWDDAGNLSELRMLFDVPPPAPGPISAHAAPRESSLMQKPDSWLAWSIISVFFCCWPFSIPAIVYASKVDGLWERGAYEEARRNARLARQWTIVSAITGFVIGMSYLLLILFGVISSTIFN